MTNEPTERHPEADYENGFRDGAGLAIEAAAVLYRAVRWHLGDEGTVSLRQAIEEYIVANQIIIDTRKGAKK